MMRLNARTILKLIAAVPALIALGKQGAAAGRAIVNAITFYDRTTDLDSDGATRRAPRRD